MRMRWLLCVLLGTLAFGQAAPGAPPMAQPAQAPGAAKAAAPADAAASVPADAAVITVNGVCPAQPKAPAVKGTAMTATSKAPVTNTSDCKTVITKAEFEKLASSVAPNITPQLKRQLAGVLPRLVAMSNQAKKKGLDKTPRYDEMLKFAKMQILTNELQKSVTEEAQKVPPEEVAEYYKSNTEAYEQYNLDRLFVPRAKQMENDAQEEDEDKDKKEKQPTEEERKAKEAEAKAKQEAAEQEMTKLAETLRGRAATGEDFVKLQKEAFDAAGMKVESPTISLPKVRRTGLPPAHAAVFELKAGEVSQVINDSGGHYIYKLNAKEELPLDQVKDEIHNTLQNQRSRDMMDKINASFKVETNEAYFGAAGGNAPPPRTQGPRMAPSPMAPQAKPQTPPGSQAPAPDAKPN